MVCNIFRVLGNVSIYLILSRIVKKRADLLAYEQYVTSAEQHWHTAVQPVPIAVAIYRRNPVFLSV